MNYSTAVFLINKNVRAVMATYEAESNAKATMFKIIDANAKVGDFIVVPTDTRHKMTVCKITAVDVGVDYDSPTKVDWAISLLDLAAHQKLVEQENGAIEKIRAAEENKKRNDLRAALMAVVDADEIKALPIYANGGETPAKS